VTATPHDLLSASSDAAALSAVLRERACGLDSAAREALLTSTAGSSAARRALLQIREALRERWPVCEDVRGSPRGLHVDGLLRVDDRSFYVHGWAYDNESTPRSLSVLAPDGSRIEVLATAFRHPHPDADGFYTSSYRRRASGFIAFFTTASPQLPTHWLVIAQNERGDGLEARCPDVIDDPRVARQTILSHLCFDDAGASLIRNHAHAAISGLQQQIAARAAIETTFDVGSVVADPAASIIVPLFGRLDLIEHQIAAMADDADVCRAEILYVLDSPELADELREKLRQLHELYRLPVRGAVMRENAGHAIACNLAAGIARSKQLVLMHSDVIPSGGGWLGELLGTEVAVASPVLLYHDDSIQHAGFKVSTTADGGVNVHEQLKGLHADLAFAGDAPTGGADAVSAACMKINKALFTAAGGFTGDFAEGEFEDVDLCTRLAAAGHRAAVLPHVRLYHLEAQSRPAKQRELAQPYNRWLLAERRKAPPAASPARRIVAGFDVTKPLSEQDRERAVAMIEQGCEIIRQQQGRSGGTTPPRVAAMSADQVPVFADARPVFVLGAARSGTSAMLRALRAAGFFCWDEGHLFNQLPRLFQVLRTEWEQRVGGLSRPPEGFACDHVGVDRLCAAMLRACDETYARAAARAGADRWAEKTPASDFAMAVPLLARAYPNGRFIYMHRHPLKVLLSRRRKFAASSPELGIADCAAAMRFWLEARRGLDASQFAEVAQADLTRRGGAVAAALAAPIGLTPQQANAMRDYWLSERPESTGSSDDASEIRLDDFDASDEQKAFLLRTCEEPARAWGYALRKHQV
jgi:GT2 family glycosyltransferase